MKNMINVTKIIIVKDALRAVAKRKPEKNSGFSGSNPDLCDTGVRAL